MDASPVQHHRVTTVLLFWGAFWVRCDNVDGPTFYQRKSGSTESSWSATVGVCIGSFEITQVQAPPRSTYSNRMF